VLLRLRPGFFVSCGEAMEVLSTYREFMLEEGIDEPVSK